MIDRRQQACEICIIFFIFQWRCAYLLFVVLKDIFIFIHTQVLRNEVNNDMIGWSTKKISTVDKKKSISNSFFCKISYMPTLRIFNQIFRYTYIQGGGQGFQNVNYQIVVQWIGISEGKLPNFRNILLVFHQPYLHTNIK